PASSAPSPATATVAPRSRSTTTGSPTEDSSSSSRRRGFRPSWVVEVAPAFAELPFPEEADAGLPAYGETWLVPSARGLGEEARDAEGFEFRAERREAACADADAREQMSVQGLGDEDLESVDDRAGAEHRPDHDGRGITGPDPDRARLEPAALERDEVVRLVGCIAPCERRRLREATLVEQVGGVGRSPGRPAPPLPDRLRLNVVDEERAQLFLRFGEERPADESFA